MASMKEKLEALRRRLQRLSLSSDDEFERSNDDSSVSCKVAPVAKSSCEECELNEPTSSWGHNSTKNCDVPQNKLGSSTFLNNTNTKNNKNSANTCTENSSQDDDDSDVLDSVETTSIMAFQRQRRVVNLTKLTRPLQTFAPFNESTKPMASMVKSTQSLQSFVPFNDSTKPPSTDDLIVNGRHYRKLNVLGKGGSSVVYQVYDEKSQACVAVKCVDLSEADESIVKAYLNEILLLKKLQWSNRVVKMLDYEHKPPHMLYVVMEKGDTDLSTLFKSLKERLSNITIAYFWAEMLKAVQVVHAEGIVHSDLKPSNFLLVAGHIKLIDFGIANTVPANKTSVTKDSQMGTLNYMSPEAISNAAGSPLEFKIKVGVKSDVWSLGCILYNMVYGKTPFHNVVHPQGKLLAITNPNYPIDFPLVQDCNVLDVMKKCLQREPKKRPSIEQLLQHPYLADKSENSTVSEDRLIELAKAICCKSPNSGARLLQVYVFTLFKLSIVGVWVIYPILN